jgi:hypothetical protein
LLLGNPKLRQANCDRTVHKALFVPTSSAYPGAEPPGLLLHINKGPKRFGASHTLERMYTM